MERLTKRHEDGQAFVPRDRVSILESGCIGLPITKLAKYEDLEEQCIKETTWSLRMLLEKWKVFFEDITELLEYRELKEQGLLLRLPCKVGDTVWEVGEIQPHIITKCKVDKFATDEAGVVYIKYHSDNFSAKRYLDAFGDTLFITKEEAERRI